MRKFVALLAAAGIAAAPAVWSADVETEQGGEPGKTVTMQESGSASAGDIVDEDVDSLIEEETEVAPEATVQSTIPDSLDLGVQIARVPTVEAPIRGGSDIFEDMNDE